LREGAKTGQKRSEKAHGYVPAAIISGETSSPVTQLIKESSIHGEAVSPPQTQSLLHYQDADCNHFFLTRRNHV
jgi:hypothetical protein